uniref:FAR1 domain-containing protein n=1 Tax=Quercus lobata TaxID=97700 RepID=A0A7N2N736_QUELO
MEEENNDDSQKLDTDYIPKLGIEFGSEQEAYDFYNECGRNYGFSIRKEWCNKRKKDGVVTSRKFTCCKERNKAPWERDGENKYERAETRIGCNAHMIIRLDKKKGKYFIHSLELNHNHILHIPQCIHMMPSQRKVSKAQAMEIDLAYDNGIKLKDSYEFMARRVGGRDALGYTKQDQKNYHYKQYEEFQGAFVKERVERNATHEFQYMVLLEKYILKRWPKDAQNEIVQDFNGHDIKANTKLKVTTRYKFLGPMCLVQCCRCCITDAVQWLLHNWCSAIAASVGLSMIPSNTMLPSQYMLVGSGPI